MSLLDRYIQEVGRFLPRKNRKDIQAELRSSLVDALEDRFGESPVEDQVAGVLKEFGDPRQVAGSFHPQGQYLVGPGLFPLFRMVAWIVIAAVLGAQLLGWGIAIMVAGEPFSPLEILASLVNSIPTSLGWVLITFMILQYYDAKPYLGDEPWDPKQLPEIKPEDAKRGELIFGLIFGTLVLVVFTIFPHWIGFIIFPGGRFYPNPVILDYLVLIQVSLLANILLDIYLLWKGHWDTLTRIIKLGLDGFSIVILSLLIIGHNTWLTARASGGLFQALEAISGMKDGGWELVGMHAWRLAFVIALIVSVIEVLTMIYKMVRNKLNGDVSAKDFAVKVD